MSIFSSIDISASGLTAERLRMDIISNNIANANTTRTKEGGPFKRKVPVFEPRKKFESFMEVPFVSSSVKTDFNGNGVRVLGIEEDDKTEFRKVYDPGHPDADKKGYVTYPNVNIVVEMVDMISASRAYEANVTAIRDAKTMMNYAVQILR